MNKIMAIFCFILVYLTLSLKAQNFNNEYSIEYGGSEPQKTGKTFDSTFVLKQIKNIDQRLYDDVTEVADKSRKIYNDMLLKINKIVVPKSSLIFMYSMNNADAKTRREIKLIRMDIQIELLAAEYKTAEKREKEKYLTKLERLLNDSFDIKEEIRRREIDELERKIDELRRALDLRQSHKDKIVGKKLLELTEDNRYMDWEGSDTVNDDDNESDDE